MFTPIILVCTVSACIAVAGPAYPDKETCERSVMEQGVTFVRQNYPEHRIVDYKCIAWGEAT